MTGVQAPGRRFFINLVSCALAVATAGVLTTSTAQADDAGLALARAAEAAGIAFTLSTVSNHEVGALNRALETPAWFQLYPVKDEATSDRIVDKAQAAGCDKLVVTVDAPALGAREWDQRNYRRPLQLSASSVVDVLLHPRWLKQVMLPRGAPVFANIAEFLPPGAQSALQGVRFMGTQINPALCWVDLERLRRRWPGKLVLKGLLSVEDARRAADVGCDGVVLGNHGGRQLDSCATGIEVVAQVADAVGDRMTVLVDGGFRRGGDVLKAIALGADGVMLGRATLYGLAAGGEAGVSHALNLLRLEMERVMTLLGCPSLDELGPQLLRS